VCCATNLVRWCRHFCKVINILGLSSKSTCVAWVYCSTNINRQVRDSHQILVDIRSLQQVIQCGLGIKLYACFIGLILAPPIPTIAAQHLIDSEPDAQAFDVLSNAGHQTDLMPQECITVNWWHYTAAGGGLEDLC